MIRFTALMLLFVIAALIQVSVLPFWGAAHYVSLPLVLLVYTAVMFQNSQARWFAVAAGFMLDLFSPMPFGTHIIALTGIVMLLELLYLRLFTNRSIYAMFVIVIVASAVYQGIWLAIGYGMDILRMHTYIPPLGRQFFWQLLVNAGVMVVLFYLSIMLQAIFRRFFLVRHSRIA